MSQPSLEVSLAAALDLLDDTPDDLWKERVRDAYPIARRIVSALGGGAMVAVVETAWDVFRELRTLAKHVLGEGRTTPHQSGLRLATAHSLIVHAAFIDEFAALCDDLSIDAEDLGLQGRLTSSSPTDVARDDHRAILSVELAGERRLDSVQQFYLDLSDGLTSHIQALPAWRDPNSPISKFRVHLPALRARALNRYMAYYAELALQRPQFAFWATAREHAGLRDEATKSAARVNSSLADVLARLDDLNEQAANAPVTTTRELLRTLATSHATAGTRLQALTDQYLAELDKPLIPLNEMIIGLSRSQIPTVDQAFIYPSYQATKQHGPELADARWWETECDLRIDLQHFFLGQITEPSSATHLIYVLGDPGAGKSLLTKVIAANTAGTAYTSVRINLRDIDGSQPITLQVEQALKAKLGSGLTWQDYVSASAPDTPVVIFDGLDELIHASQVPHANYLEKLAEFQDAARSEGHPVVVIVTARLLVADRCRVPSGTLTIRLRPFDSIQQQLWLRRWNRRQPTKSRQLSGADVSPFADLASQPLLLLLMAVFVADGGNLKTASRTELYEAVLLHFAQREVRRRLAGALDEQIAQAVEAELRQLSLVAVGMFMRGQQSLTLEELQTTSQELAGEDPRRTEGSAGEGYYDVSNFGPARFFFVYESVATSSLPVGRSSSRRFEFLHATFNEYLTARWLQSHLADISKAIPQLPALRTSVDRLPVFRELLVALSTTLILDRIEIAHTLGEVVSTDVGLRDGAQVALDTAIDLAFDAEGGWLASIVIPTDGLQRFSVNLVVLNSVGLQRDTPVPSPHGRYMRRWWPLFVDDPSRWRAFNDLLDFEVNVDGPRFRPSSADHGAGLGQPLADSMRRQSVMFEDEVAGELVRRLESADEDAPSGEIAWLTAAPLDPAFQSRAQMILAFAQRGTDRGTRRPGGGLAESYVRAFCVACGLDGPDLSEAWVLAERDRGVAHTSGSNGEGDEDAVIDVQADDAPHEDDEDAVIDVRPDDAPHARSAIASVFARLRSDASRLLPADAAWLVRFVLRRIDHGLLPDLAPLLELLSAVRIDAHTDGRELATWRDAVQLLSTKMDTVHALDIVPETFLGVIVTSSLVDEATDPDSIFEPISLTDVLARVEWRRMPAASRQALVYWIGRNEFAVPVDYLKDLWHELMSDETAAAEVLGRYGEEELVRLVAMTLDLDEYELALREIALLTALSRQGRLDQWTSDSAKGLLNDFRSRHGHPPYARAGEQWIHDVLTLAAQRRSRTRIR